MSAAGICGAAGTETMKGAFNMKTLDSFYNREQVQEITGYGITAAQQVIRKINRELEAQGYITRRGYVSKKAFDAAYNIKSEASHHDN